MSDFDKAIAALVAVEVNKQLGERNSLPNVKRASITAAQWKDIIALEAWKLLPKSHSPYIDDDGVEYDYILHKYFHTEPRFVIPIDIIADAVHNVGAPARFRSMDLVLARDSRFEILKGGFNLGSNKKDVYRAARCFIK